jgi:hypothetical protein
MKNKITKQTLPAPPDTADLVAASSSVTTDEQRHEVVDKQTKPPENAAPLLAPATPIGAPQRHGDRGNADAEPALHRWVRYKDLVRANIVRDWSGLFRLIDEQDFPEGVLLSAHKRAWRVDWVEAWLAARPSERKVLPMHRARRSKQKHEKRPGVFRTGSSFQFQR